MPKPIIFLPEALADACEAYAWYEGKELGLGDEFYRALSVALTYVAQNPDSPVKIHGNYRRVLLRQFPYAVFYRHDPKFIHIFSVFHCSQNPVTWMNSLNS